MLTFCFINNATKMKSYRKEENSQISRYIQYYNLFLFLLILFLFFLPKKLENGVNTMI